jgi:hypothetical protein
MCSKWIQTQSYIKLERTHTENISTLLECAFVCLLHSNRTEYHTAGCTTILSEYLLLCPQYLQWLESNFRRVQLLAWYVPYGKESLVKSM